MPNFTTTDGASLYYTDTGTGVPVLCLAGLTRTTGDFKYVAPHLGNARLVCMDYRGRGQSDWADPSTYTIPHEARDALALLDHLGIEKTAVLGTSRGGLIAMLFAATAKARLLGVCLNDIGPELMEDGLNNIRAYLGRRPTQSTVSEAAALRGTLLPGFLNVPQERLEAEAHLHCTEGPEGLNITYDPKLRDAVLSARTPPTPDLWPLFDALDGLPLALIRGENSNILSLETARTMAQKRPDMLWAEVPDRGHVPFLDEPNSLTVLHSWLETLK